MELNVIALLQGLSDTFAPVARLRGIVVTHHAPQEPVCITTSLEGVLPSFTALLVKLLYLLREGHYCQLSARFITDHDQLSLRLQIALPKIYFNPNVLIPGLDKIMQLDNRLPDRSIIYADVVLDEPSPSPVVLPVVSQPLPDALASHYMAEQFGERARLFAEDRLTRDKIRATTSVRDAQFLTIIEQTIATHLDDADLDADRLGRATGLSKAQLFRRLKQLTGFSAANYIRHVRLHRACDLLRSTDLSIGEVAYRVGFQDLSYFTRSFTEAFGSNPSDWRKQHKVKQ